MLDLGVAGGKGKDITDKSPIAESAGAKAAFGLNHHHQVCRVGGIVLTPDIILQVLGQAEFAHADQIADDQTTHAPNLRTSADTVARKS